MEILIESNSEQRTAEWYRQRLGKVTASGVGDVTAKTKTGWGAARTSYLMRLVVERLTGAPVERFTNAAMEWGTATEPVARAAYCSSTDQMVHEVGFIEHPEIAMSGALPDGLIGIGLGLIEIKCPTTATHVETLLGEPIDAKYIKQMQWQMACTRATWCDFVSFDPRLPLELQLYVRRVHRDDAAIASLEADVRQFLAEVDDKLNELAAIAGLEPGHIWLPAFDEIPF